MTVAFTQGGGGGIDTGRSGNRPALVNGCGDRGRGCYPELFMCFWLEQLGR